ncbi:MAG: metallophosphoesterase [Clostridia bacterium]|nr:metallophosphoesterase [Clostridia bacterium]
MKSKKKLFVVSDIHGHFTPLKEALETAGFEGDNPEHLLICCGDYFDRGNENLHVLKFFERVGHKVLLRGNHEDLLLKLLQTGKVLSHNYLNGTMQTLTDFFGKYSIDPIDDTIDFSGKSRTVDRLCDFIGETVNYYETENYVFVHGWLPEQAKASADLQRATDRSWEQARWTKWIDRYDGAKPLEDKTLICGHVPTFYASKFDKSRDHNSHEIFFGNGIIAIDTGTYDTKKINVLVLEDRLTEV